MTLPNYPSWPLPWAPALAGWFGRPARCRARLEPEAAHAGFHGRCDLVADHVALDAPPEARAHALERGMVVVRFAPDAEPHLESP